MKYRYLTFFLILTTSIFAAVRPQMQAFNAGELSPLMRLRSDFSKYDSGCVTFQNMIPLSQGPAFRRPGLKYIATSPGPYPELICDYASDAIPTEPADTALSGETEITDKTGLAAMAGAGHYAIMNDIDASGAWTPIANFSGVLEGNGFTISNLTVSGADDQGMFENFSSNAEVRNLILREFTVTGSSDSVGALVGKIYTAAGVDDAVIKNVMVVSSTITGTAGVGGMVGLADSNDVRIFRCTGYSNTIVASAGYAGGLVGWLTQDASKAGKTYLANCATYGGLVQSATHYAGGLVGYFEGEFDSDAIVGNRSIMHSCHSTTDVEITAPDNGSMGCFGGLIGVCRDVNITDCYATGDIYDNGVESDAGIAGGFAGLLYPNCDVTNCYSTGDITLYGAADEVGGFIGKHDTELSIISHCYTTSNILIYQGVHDTDRLGEIGGFVGGSWNIADPVEPGLYQYCWALGSVWTELGGTYYTPSGMGGFIGGTGFTYSAEIENCYTKASVIAGDDDGSTFGGFIGTFEDTAVADCNVTNCYAANELSTDANGFLGMDGSTNYDVNAVNCFWDIEISGATLAGDCNATGLSTAAMQLQTTFTDVAWDFTDIWVSPDEEKRLLSFEHSEDDVYINEYGHKYMRVFRDGGQVLHSVTGLPVQVRTPFEGSDLFDIQYVQLADTIFLTCPNHPPQKLTRSSHSDWTMQDMDIRTGPFMDENVTTTTITPSSVEGVVLLTASEALWDASDIGALWRLGHRRASTVITGILDANESSSTIEIYGDYNYSLQGTWEGTVTLEKSYDDGTNWVTQVPRYNKGSSIKEDYSHSEGEANVLFRVTMTDYISGTATYNLVVYDRVQYGVVKIDDFISTTVVKGTVFSTLGGTGATTKWAEGYWSDNNGWPRTIEFHEFRMFYGGNEAYPQTIWASRTDDYNDLTTGLLDTHALTYTLPSQNSMQWMLSHDYLFIGTLGGCGRLGKKDEGMAPTIQPVFREQSKFGGKYMEAIMAGDSIIYVERTGRKVREIVYNLERDRFVAPDLTILAEHITGDGINDWAFQKRPDPTIWYIRDDGHFLSMTYNRLEHDVVGFGDHVTDGNALSVATIPSSNEDEVWFVIERTIDSNNVKYIEQMQPRDFGDQEDAFYVDCGLTYDSTAATSFSGWDHLEGETVSILADGLVVDNNSISSGAFGLSTAASVVHAGLPYNSILETMPIVFTSNEGSTAAQRKQTAELRMNFYETLGTKYGIEGNTKPVYFDADVTLQSGWAETSLFSHGYTDDLTIYLEQIQPLPLTLRSLIPKITVTEH